MEANPPMMTEWQHAIGMVLALSTLTRYSDSVSRWWQWHTSEDKGEMTAPALAEYIHHLRKRGASDNHIHSVTAALRSYVRHTGRSDLLPHLPYKRHRRQPPQRVLTLDECRAVLATIPSHTTTGQRDRAMFLLHLDTGLRSSELLGLTVPDVDLSAMAAAIVRKGGRLGQVVFCEATAQALAHWLTTRAALAPKHRRLFCGVYRPHNPLTLPGLRMVYKRLAARAEIPGFAGHALRRTMATVASRAGAPMRILQAQGGWRDAEIVRRYTETISPDDFREYSPVRAINK